MSSYEKIKDGVRQDLDEVPFEDVRRVFTLAAIYPFFSKWFSGSTDPMPSTLSRHVTDHNANPIHINPGDSLISVLLVTSLLRTFQEDGTE